MSSSNNNNTTTVEQPGVERAPAPTRLVDYFVVVQYSGEKSPRSHVGSGVLLQQFPNVPWVDVPFAFDPDNKGIGLEGRDRFLQPEGWKLSPVKKDPKFYVSILTDALGARTYCACLCLHEPYTLVQTEQFDEDEEMLGEDTEDTHQIRQARGNWFAPKVLCLLSRLNLRDTFRYCLGTIYKAFIENSAVKLETMVGRLLSQVNIPPPGGPQYRFTIGVGDFQIIQPPLSATIPVTGTSVTLLVHQIGIANLLSLFGAVVTEQKILFHSKSGSRLYDACGALEAIMFPLKWLHTFIPLLPSNLIDIVQTPTPFIIGVLTETYEEITEILTDVIVVDLDGGSIYVPEALPSKVVVPFEARVEMPHREKRIAKMFKRGKKGETFIPAWNEEDAHKDEQDIVKECDCIVPQLPESLRADAFKLLSGVIHPELSYCDQAFPPLAIKPSTPFRLDKEIRAVFIRLIVHLLQGYRSCLVIIRIHPTPVITFHHAKFLGGRGLSQNKFVVSLLNTQGFNQFVSERGSPYRPLDIWDEYYAKFEEQWNIEKKNEKLIYEHLSEVANHLAQNESPDSNYALKSLKPPDWSQMVHDITFPLLATDLVDKTIRDEGSKHIHRTNSAWSINQPKVVVPYGPKVLHTLDQAISVTNNSARRLEVIRTCVANIFENQVVQASKSIHAVKKALGSRDAKLVFCEELRRHVNGNVATLDRYQFDMVVALMQCALQATNETDEEGVAAALLPLAMTFCRKLCPGVIQYAYTSIQDHPVWKNQNFWETSFYSDVERDLLAFYSFSSEIPSLHNSNHRPNDIRPSGGRTALDVAAEQLRLLPTIDAEKLKELSASDESTLYSQAIHYSNRMVALLTKMDTHARKKEKDPVHPHHHHHFPDNVSNITSIAESDSVGGESTVEDSSHDASIVLKIIGRFLDKVCTEGGVLDAHSRRVTAMIRDALDMQIETLDAVNRESKRLPPIVKPKIPDPYFLAGEELMMDSIRVMMLLDGREIGETVGGTGSDASSNLNKSPIPAEGALFLTNYRIIFKGYPTDRTVAIPVIIRSLPLMALTKEKRITVNDLGIKDQEGSLIRSATFQLLRLAFDEEVGPETIEMFRKTLQKFRYPADIFSFFTFAGQTLNAVSVYHGTKDKNSTLKKFLHTAKKVGVKPKANSKKQKYVLSWPQGGGTLPASTKYPGNSVLTPPHNNSSREDGDSISLESGSSLSGVSDDEFTPPLPVSDTKSFEKLLERSYSKDWRRLGFGNPTRTVGSSASTIIYKAESMRFSVANSTYSLCGTYPALLVVPQVISDESLKNLSLAYNCGRFPVITWKHPTTRALLLRGAAMNTKGLTSRVFSSKNPSGGVEATHLEQENFLRAVVNATPGKPGRPLTILSLYDSNMSLNSPHHGLNHHLAHNESKISNNNTPDSGRRISNPGPFQKAMDTIRYAAAAGTSGGKGSPSYSSWGFGKSKTSIAKPYLTMVPFRGVHNPLADLEHEAEKRIPMLYVFVDKSKIKGLKGDATTRVEFIPANPCPDLSKLRSSFKQVLRACIPSTPGVQNFLVEFERSEWLVHLQSIMRLSGAIIELMDKQGSSVMLCLGDGADFTTELSALAQISLDPYYRTMEGFHALIEKEWLGFGHKFSERNNLSGVDGYRGKDSFTPVFIQFLDIVHQMMLQFPLQFEFNQRYLKYLAYHSVSGRFRTFLFDSEWDRVRYGFVALDDKRGSLSRQYRAVDSASDDTGRKAGSNSCQSLFEYVEKVKNKHPIFRNFLYDKQSEIKVLYLATGLNNLVPWDYFVEDSIGIGSPYDLELLSQEEAVNEERDKHDNEFDRFADRHEKHRDWRKIVSAVVDGPDPDYFSHILEEFNRTEMEKCLLPQDWCAKWDRIESTQVPPLILPILSKFEGIMTTQSREAIEAAHKKATVDILIQGKVVQKGDIPATSHKFVRKTYTTLMPCQACSGILLGKVALECEVCASTCHEKCAELIPTCTGEDIGNGVLMDSGSISCDNDMDMPAPLILKSPRNYYDKFKSKVTDETSYAGFLFKRGAMLKGWTQRYFVLDSTKHQLRYYESKEDTHPKGFIDLSEVKRCGYPETTAPQIGTLRKEKQDDGCIFEVKTTKRVYSFAATNAEIAGEWIERIQGSLI